MTPAFVKFNNIVVFATAVTGAIGGAKFEVYNIEPNTYLKFDIYPVKYPGAG
jgi:hypothetical protein